MLMGSNDRLPMDDTSVLCVWVVVRTTMILLFDAKYVDWSFMYSFSTRIYGCGWPTELRLDVVGVDQLYVWIHRIGGYVELQVDVLCTSEESVCVSVYYMDIIFSGLIISDVIIFDVYNSTLETR